MKRALMFVAVLAASLAMADDLVASKGDATVRLTQGECFDVVLAILRPELRDRVKAAHATVGGKQYRACWMVRSDGDIGLLYEDGDEGLVPRADLKREPGA
jgi:hypothetical protein